MEALKRLVLQGEDGIARGVFERVSARGYGQRMPMTEEGCREEVEMISANLVQALELEQGIGPVSGSADVTRDPIAAVGARMARARASETTDPALLLGLLKCYRESYLDLVLPAGLPRDQMHDSIRAIGRFFDRLEVGVMPSGAGSGVSDANATAGDRRASLVEERNRYLAAFSSLPLPALFIDPSGRVEHINAAAALLFGPSDLTRARYFQNPADREAPPVLSREIADFRDGPDTVTSFETELKTAKGTRYFQVRFTKTPSLDGSPSGVLVVFSDLTHRRNAVEALRKSQAQYAALFEHMPIGFVRMRVLLDRRNRPADHTVLEVNPAFEHLTGVGAEALVGKPFTEALRQFGAQGDEWMDALGRAALTGESASFDAEIGSEGRWVSVSTFSPSPGHVAIMLSDVTAAKLFERSLARSRDSYLTLLEGLPSLVWRAGPDGRVDFVNAAWLEFTGAKADAGPDAWMDAVHPEDRARRAGVLRHAAAERRSLELEYRLLRADGESRWVLERGRPIDALDGTFAGLIGTTVDITDRRGRDEALEELSTRDTLTGLPNGRMFEDSLTRAIAQGPRGHSSVVLLADVDGFAHLNAACGHESADGVLRAASELIGRAVRSGDLTARVGADAFAVLLPDASMENARSTARRILDATRATPIGPDGDVVTVSIGLAAATDGADAATVMARAEAAVKCARGGGGDASVVNAVDSTRDEEVSEGRRVTELLESALDGTGGSGLLLFYQPVFRADDGANEYSESLVRLRDAEGRVLAPADFVAVAGRAGLMRRMTRWVVRTAVADLSQVAGSRTTVNVTRDVAHDPDLLADARAWASAAGVSTSRLTFELSDDEVLLGGDDLRRWTEAARESGFGLAIDHVGLGRQSFAHLQDLHFDRLTIDGGIISSLVGEPRKVSVVRAIQEVATALGVRAVAQWIEDGETLAIVRDVGVDMVQGFYLRAPAAGLSVEAADASGWTSPRAVGKRRR
jgi:diguanylate cyclase